MSDSMVERMAKALEPKCRAFGQGDMPITVAREFARAVLEAMREPTPQMCEFAEDNFDRDADPIAVCWRAMISKAMEE